MLRAMRLVMGAAAVFFGGTLLAQGTKDADGYFPIKPKTKWTYKAQDQTVEVVVAGTEKYENEECTKVDTLHNGKLIASELYTIKPDGVYRVRVKDEKIDKPVKVLALPAKKGTEWEIKSKVGNQNVTGKFKIVDDKAKIMVPLGEFETVYVEGADLDVAGTKTTVKVWFAKDKGIVKLSYKIQDAESVLELQKIEEGK